MSLCYPPCFSSLLIVEPRIVMSSSNMSLIEGQTLELNCEASANPIPMYRWTYNNKSLEYVNKAKFLIKSIKRDDAGVFQCTASNRHGEASKKMTVDVWCELNFMNSGSTCFH